MLRCSFYSCAQDNTPKPWEGTWDALLKILDRDNFPRRGTQGDDAKKSLPAIAGSTNKPGCAKRGRDAVEGLHLLILDIDNAHEEPTGEFWPDKRTGLPTNRPKLRKVCLENPVTFAEAYAALASAGVDAYMWETWSCKPDWPKLRVVIPLEHRVPASLWEAALEFALASLGLGALRRGLDLPVARDVARMNFLPASPTGLPVRRAHVSGHHLGIPLDALAVVTVPEPVVQPWQEKLIRTHQGQTSVRWARRFRDASGRLLDLRTLDGVRLLESLGCTVGPARSSSGGTKHRTTCPWAREHGGALDDDCGVLFLNHGRWPTWHCSHSGHVHLGLADLLDAAGVLHD